MFPEDRSHGQSLENRNQNVTEKDRILFVEFLLQPFTELGLQGLPIFTATSFRQVRPLLKA